jgi:hypothetical protein
VRLGAQIGQAMLRRYLKKAADAELLIKGDVPGHAFHGNQWTGASAELREKVDRLKAMSSDERDNMDIYKEGLYPAYVLYEAEEMMPKKEDSMKGVNEVNSFALYQEADAIANVGGRPFLASREEDMDDEEKTVWSFTNPANYISSGFLSDWNDKKEAIAQFKAHLASVGKFAKGAIDDAAHDAQTSPFNADPPYPTAGRAQAGNYRKGHIRISGLDISIENPIGSHRRPEWPALSAHYGYIRRTAGADGDHVDVFVKEGTSETYNGPVFVIDQEIGGKFDEHKVMIGWRDRDAAVSAYLACYQAGWQVGPVTALTFDEFKAWLKDGDTTRPLSKAITTPNTRMDLEQRFNVTVVDKTEGAVALQPVLEVVYQTLDGLAGTGALVQNALAGYSLLFVTLYPGEHITSGCYRGALADYELDEATLYVAAERPLVREPLALGQGAHNVATDLATIVSHEVGHLIMPDVETAIGRSLQQIFDDRGAQYWVDRISTYAGTSGHELFAEAFAAYTHPDYAGDLPSELIDVFEASGINPDLVKGDKSGHEFHGNQWTASNGDTRPAASLDRYNDNPVKQIEMWYDRHTRNWVVDRKDADGNSTHPADFVYSRKEADATVREYLEWHAGSQRIGKFEKGELEKARTPKTPTDLGDYDGDTADFEDNVDELLQAVDDGNWLTLEELLTKDIERQYKDGGLVELTTVGLTDDARRLHLVDQEAASYAADHAAELVTDLEDSTRSQLKGLVQDALTESWTQDELTDAIGDSFAFSETRATMISQTELSNAHSRGRVGVATEAGATGKRWLLSVEHDDAENCWCSDAEEAGVVDFDDDFVEDYDFPPGHPNCLCDWVGVYPSDDDEGDDDEGDEEDDEGAAED